MEIERSSILPLESMEEELKHCLLSTTLELENTKIAIEEELKKRDDQLLHLKDLLDMVIFERDEAQGRYQSLLLENIILQQQQQQQQLLTSPNPPLSGAEEDELRRGKDPKNGFSSSECEESIVSASPTQQQLPNLDPMVPDKPLPEKGKLLQAVMRAGPLLQTLLLAGPLPEWRRPPPPIDSSEIPPVKIPSSPPPSPPIFLQESLLNCGRVCGKRGVPPLDFESPPIVSKCQRALLL